MTVSNSNIGVGGLLWVAFIVLKLMEVVHWSWWLIICWPLLVGGIVGIVTLIIGFGIMLYLEHQKDKHRLRRTAFA